MTKEKYLMLAKEAFQGQFPNKIIMDKPILELMSSRPFEITDELWEWFVVSIDKYEELVEKPKSTKFNKEKHE